MSSRTEAQSARRRQPIRRPCFWYMRPPQFPQQRQQQKQHPTSGTRMMKRTPMAAQMRKPSS